MLYPFNFKRKKKIKTSDLKSDINRKLLGEVTEYTPSNCLGEGLLKVKVKKKQLNAISYDKKKIPIGSIVLIVGIVGSVLIVTNYKDI